MIEQDILEMVFIFNENLIDGEELMTVKEMTDHMSE